MANDIYESPRSELNTPPPVEKPVELSAEEQKLKGLGGWLILVAIGVLYSPIKIAFFVYSVFVPIITDGTWGAVTSIDSQYYIPYLGTFLIFELIVNACLFLASIYLIYLFFKKHYLFPKAYIGILVISLAFIIIDAVIGSLFFPEDPIFDSETMKELGRGMASVFIWVPYMLVSKRVKLTFVENKPPPQA